MTIDERIEALTMSLELQAHESAKHDRQIEQILKAIEQDGEHIRTLARIAEIHERRITHIEDGSQ
jgi:hypothetical protein